MLRVVVRRLLQLAISLIVLSALLFGWLRSLPGGPIDALLGDKATPEKRALLRQALGYDEPIWVQYGRFCKNVLLLNFGNSVRTGDPVTDVIGRSFPATIELAFFALLIAVSLGIPLGYLAARHRGGFLDTLVLFGTLIGVAVPVFFLGYFLKDVFTQQLHWFPPSSRLSVDMQHTRVTGVFVLDGILTRELDA